MFFEQMLNNSQKIQEKINQITAQLKTLPNGTLVCCRNRNQFNWYHSTGSNKEYIPKANKAFAAQLAYKKQLLLQLQELEAEKQALESYFKKILSNHKLQEFNAHPEYQNLISTYSNSKDKEILQWKNSPYEKNNKHPEKLVYKIASGNVFRSKSESIIALCLEKYNIPYRYECALYLNDFLSYPDFTIMHPRTGQIFYWEHFGLMDQTDYIKNTYSKLSLYATNGIVPSIQLITTYETQNNPLDISRVEAIIQHYFIDS